MTRKGFIGGMLASAAGCRAAMTGGRKPELAFGVISDIHVTTPESTAKFRSALRYFRDRGVHAVMVAGDLSDWGLKSGFRYMKSAWDEEMGGTGIVPLFITGNHDFNGWWYGDMTLDMHLQGYSEDEALSKSGMRGCWEETFGEEYAEVRLREVNGYRFVSSEWRGASEGENGERVARWLEAHRAELSGPKPFFFFRHLPVPNTVSSSPENRDDALFRTLSTFPNCIVFTGHTHRTYNDERSIWQGGFTAVSVPSMSYASMPKGYENGADKRKPETKAGMERIDARERLLEAQGYLVRVDEKKVTIERHDFEVGKDTAEPWTIPLTEERPYAFETRGRMMPKPVFAKTAAVKTTMVNGDLRNGSWTIFVGLEFPSAIVRGGRVWDYEVRVVDEKGQVKGKKLFLSPGCYLPSADEPMKQSFRYNGFDLPQNGRFRFETVARNAFGGESKPICSRWFSPKPGKDKAERFAVYPGWKPGELDIHFIHTGVGEQTFFIFPDGTTMLLDCGDTHHGKYMVDVPPQPSAERCGGEWTSRYIQQLVSGREIDYLMVSHWHGDHIGDPSLGCWRNRKGQQICGITAVAEDFRFRHYFDHQFPNAGEHALDPDKEAFGFFQKWLAKARTEGMDAQQFRVGAKDQIRLLHDAEKYPGFSVRNLAANGKVWDGKDGVIDCAAEMAKGGRGKIHENRLSAAIRIDYGKFSYYSGGDNELELFDAQGKAFNWEELVGKACGPVTVAKTNHHAGTHAMSPEFCRTVRPKVWLSSVWQANMVDDHSLKSMCSRELYPGERYVCFGYVADKVKSVAEKYGKDIAPAGHTVVKVAPGGGKYEVFTLSSADESMRIISRRADEVK